MKIILILCVGIHLFLVLYLLFSPKRLGRGEGDRSHDPYYGIFSNIGLYGIIFSAQVYAIAHYMASQNSVFYMLSGMAFFTFGIIVRIWAVRTLGFFFSMELGLRNQHKLLVHGPFRWIRHPSYLGYLFMLIGFAMAAESWVAFFIPMCLALGFLVLRIRDEEQMLHQHFGVGYSDYCLETKCLIPFIW